MLDAAARIRLLRAVPTSFSGDWYEELSHYFDEFGRTTAFERRSNFFSTEECASVVRERSVVFFGGGRVALARDYTLEDGKGALISPKACDFPYRHGYRIFTTVASALAAERLAAVVAAAGVALDR